jgi:hypothetical protein
LVALVGGVGLGATTARASGVNRGPADTLVVCGVTTVTTAPSYTALGCGFNNSGATYDLVAGQFSVGATGSGAEAELMTGDIFTISGPSSTRPIPFTVQLAVHVGYYDKGTSTVRIGSGDQTQEFSNLYTGGFPQGSSYQILTLPLSKVAGEHFQLALHLHAFSPNATVTSNATASARLTFVLPPDYVATSSQGYSSVPTPTRTTTWGRLKTIYR